MRVLIVYDSRRGTTRAVAERIGRVALGWTPRVEVRSVRETRPGRAETADVLFLGCWVHGLIVVGVGPSAGASEWAESLPALGGTVAGVFCTYDVKPKQTLPVLAAALRARGAEVVAGHASRRRNRFAGVDAFATAVLEDAASRSPAAPSRGPAAR